MERLRTRLRLNLDRAGAVAAILRTIVGSENFEFGDGFGVGVNVQGGIGTVVHIVAAVKLPVVVFGAAAVDGVGYVAIDTHPTFVLSRLIHDAGTESRKLCEVAPIQYQFTDLLTGDGGTEFGGSSLDLGDAFACDLDGFRNRSDGKDDVNAGLFGDV